MVIRSCDHSSANASHHHALTLVDALGLLITVQAVAANVPEREEAKQLLAKLDQKRH
ncbi:MAG: hypothetical protein KME45_06175 [Stenomitos rutilans HA7619-LM2]|nr:hypothetical protein [Stenomitos rutilans HA7619-LM2]